jgi:drug/metabolite transporter (DMT)-like permease
VRWIQLHAFILSCVLFTVSSQLLMRWRVGLAGPLPEAATDRVEFLVRLLLTPWIWLAVACTFLAGVSWMLALTRFELSYAFPFTGASFLVMLFAGAFLFHEHVSIARIAGTLLVLLGLVVVVRS